MIIQNGYIKFKNRTENGFDENGYPIEATENDGDYIECQYQTSNFSFQGHNSNTGNFTIASYSILINEMEIEDNTEVLELFNNSKKSIGTFSIVSITPLPTVSLIKILV